MRISYQIGRYTGFEPLNRPAYDALLLEGCCLPVEIPSENELLRLISSQIPGTTSAAGPPCKSSPIPSTSVSNAATLCG